MSRTEAVKVVRSVRFPRVSGDEAPGLQLRYSITVFSPRERG